MARDEGVTGIVGQVLSIPVMCHPKFFDRVPNKDEHELLSYTQNFDVPLVDALRMEFFWDCYVGADVRPDVLHSPLLSTNLRNLPPAGKLDGNRGRQEKKNEGCANRTSDLKLCLSRAWTRSATRASLTRTRCGPPAWRLTCTRTRVCLTGSTVPSGFRRRPSI